MARGLQADPSDYGFTYGPASTARRPRTRSEAYRLLAGYDARALSAGFLDRAVVLPDRLSDVERAPAAA